MVKGKGAVDRVLVFVIVVISVTMDVVYNLINVKKFRDILKFVKTNLKDSN